MKAVIENQIKDIVLKLHLKIDKLLARAKLEASNLLREPWPVKCLLKGNPVDRKFHLRSRVRCQRSIGLNTFNRISNNTGRVSIVNLQVDLEQAILSIERGCTPSVRVPFKKKRDRDNLEGA